MISHKRFVLQITLLFLLPLTARAADKTLLEIDDLYRADDATELTVRPDGKQAMYTRRWADRAFPLKRLSLWRVDGTGENRQPLEPGEPDGQRPVYSPDGKWIAFLSGRNFLNGSPAFRPVPPYTEPASDIWLIPANGGQAIPLAGPGKPYGRVLGDNFYARVAFSPDGKRLVFVADDRADPRTPDEIAHRFTIVRDDQGEGYEGYGAAQVWVADLAEKPTTVAATKVRRLTAGDAWYGDPQWSPDGKYLVVHANRTDDRESVRFSINKNYDLWRIDAETGEIGQLTTGPGPEVSPRLSPDGRRLVCLSSPRKGPHADVYNLLVVDLDSAEPRSRVLFDHHQPDVSRAPHGSPSFPLPTDTWLDAERFYFDSLQGMNTRREMIDLARSDSVSQEFSQAEHKQYDEQQQARRRLTPATKSYVQDRIVAEEEIVRWKSFDGLEIEGVLTFPPESVAKRPYKLLLHPHGGPHSRSTRGFNFTVQLFAANGYAVFQPNFRGSTSYGRQFLDADRHDMGGGDMRDILTGIDHLVSQGVIDPRRQFVYGVSYGGFMTSWLIGQTNQFRAAAPQNAVTDLNAMWGLSDLQSWTEWEYGGLPWEVPDAMRKHSPLTYASKVRTPTLILHADHDRRCPLPMGTMYYRVLKKAGVETEMVIYHDERHGIAQLAHQADIYRRVLAWFEKHDLAARQ
jgi:dipeptidyl aminopeptidase/acylaminoacyl peptidase